MPIEFGIRQGLAQDFGYDQLINDQRYHQQQMRNAKINSEAKAKMLADDFDYNNAMNSWDHAQVKDFAQGHIKKIGQFIRENPDWSYNVGKRAMYNSMVKELKDNQMLHNGLSVDMHMKNMQDYMNKPENQDVVNTPEFQKYIADRDRYLETGTIDPSGKKKLFEFHPPEEAVDYNKFIMDAANQTKHDHYSPIGNQGHHISVSQDQKLKAVDYVLQSRDYGKWIKKDYSNYVSSLEDPKQAKSLNNWLVNKMDPFFKSDEYDKGFPPTQKINGDSKKIGDNMSAWKGTIDIMMGNPKQRTDITPHVAQKMFANDQGEWNMDGVRTPFGELVNLGVRNGNATGVIRVVKNPDNKTGRAYAESYVDLPVSDFANLGEKYNKAINKAMFDFGKPNSDAKNWEIEDGYQDKFTKVVNKDGVPFVRMKTEIPFDPNNIALSTRYGQIMGLNHEKDDQYEGTSVEKNIVHQQKINGVNYTLYDNGDLIGSNGTKTNVNK